MSRTRRKYNDPRKKIFRVMFIKFSRIYFNKEVGRWVCVPPGVKEYERLKHSVLCMGKCPMCRDHKMDNVKKTGKKFLLDLAVKTVTSDELKMCEPAKTFKLPETDSSYEFNLNDS